MPGLPDTAPGTDEPAERGTGMVRIEFNTENAAFEEGGIEEITRILLRLVQKIGAGLEAGSILDVNGNRIGSWDISR